MPLESCMICIDNSEYTRNGDYMPNRLQAQVDAVNLLTTRKLNAPSHPESTVGILSLAGKGGVQVRVSPTRDQTKLLTATQGISCEGKLSFCDGVKIAQLALKHRQNKAGEQRILLFVCSPIDEKEKDLKKLGNSLRKGGICVDIVSMGEIECNEETLVNFLKIVDKDGENSHLITIAAGTLPSNALRQSVVFGGGITGSGASGGGNGDATGGEAGFAEFGGIDPEADPEMAMVLQMSLMEERARQEAASNQNADGEVKDSGDVEISEEDLLQQALLMSEAGDEGGTSAVPATPAVDASIGAATTTSSVTQDNVTNSPSFTTPAPTTTSIEAPGAPAAATTTATTSGTDAGAFLDPSFVEGMLADLPGVDLKDPRIIAAMNLLSGDGAADTRKEGDDEEMKDEKKDDK